MGFRPKLYEDNNNNNNTTNVFSFFLSQIYGQISINMKAAKKVVTQTLFRFWTQKHSPYTLVFKAYAAGYVFEVTLYDSPTKYAVKTLQGVLKPGT